MARTIQEGVYYQQGTRPGNFYTILFLGSEPDANATSARDFLRQLWTLYQDLKRGQVRDLPGHPVPAGDLKVLIGYGPNVFKIPGTKETPPELEEENWFLSPRDGGGGPLLFNSGLSYADDINKNIATVAVAFQFIADTQLAVHRATVETWKFLADYASQVEEPSPFAFAGFFDGFQRDDFRSWIDFHDGLSNLRSGKERENVIRIKDGEYEGGTSMCYLRLTVDLPVWRRLGRTEQELLVGRDKLTGCPLSDVGPSGEPIVESGCPVMGHEITEEANDDYREPPLVTHPTLLQSHVQRANLAHSTDFAVPQSLRIFRQGFEFIEPVSAPPGFRVGLNFVSFQDTPQRVIRLLTRDEWLGGTNFGGSQNPRDPRVGRLLSVRAGANFLVPPVDENEQFPGENIFSI